MTLSAKMTMPDLPLKPLTDQKCLWYHRKVLSSEDFLIASEKPKMIHIHKKKGEKEKNLNIQQV